MFWFGVQFLAKPSDILWTQELLYQLILLLEASERADRIEHIRIDGGRRRYDVRLHHLHHWQFQLQFALTTSRHPGMFVDFRQLARAQVEWLEH